MFKKKKQEQDSQISQENVIVVTDCSYFEVHLIPYYPFKSPTSSMDLNPCWSIQTIDELIEHEYCGENYPPSPSPTQEIKTEPNNEQASQSESNSEVRHFSRIKKSTDFLKMPDFRKK